MNGYWESFVRLIADYKAKDPQVIMKKGYGKLSRLGIKL